MKLKSAWLTWVDCDVSGVPGDLDEDEGVGDDDDDERKHVNHDEVEDVVGHLVQRRREKVEGHALRKPREHRVTLHVKYDALKQLSHWDSCKTARHKCKWTLAWRSTWM